MELHAQLRVTALSHEPTTLSLKGRSIFYVVKLAHTHITMGVGEGGEEGWSGMGEGREK